MQFRQKRIRRRIAWISCAILILIAGWFSFGPSPQAKQNKEVVIATVGESDADAKLWKSIAETAKEDYGITIKVKDVTDATALNKMVASGEVDMNAFQHYAYLKSWNKANHQDLVAIGKTYIAPLNLYSKKYQSLSEIPDGATIAIPNDASNESRALYVLKNAGLIKIKPHQSLATVADVTDNPKHLKLKEVSGDQSARILSSVAASVVTNTYAVPAKLEHNIIYHEKLDKDSAPWINILVTRKKDKNKKIYQEVVKAYQTQKTKQLTKKYYNGTQLPAWDTKLK
ncbi:MetQ/NlpA family ABC transporter substrate-binding protein [Lactobacillus sp. PV037]|uniref:MetQ/NlpA family ABC transporter substrate-binding protein n=1 Tax=unclassified Lactobacillus TaxID=2620435 RepID=UPI00223ECF06|nr:MULTISPECIES: MetQ/NlpA family ABC transporter substrate-binding protein [unclassified Lactobacillus]QNQ81739.1 MetQ/NlpA family ABC transporter substrate-binding protein [Lactobacillus sp. PV012]QNQ84216.1 MetQ/NlpA family ABC transporter substrate-binding protein [Lactobacillus sp. PV037]